MRIEGQTSQLQQLVAPAAAVFSSDGVRTDAAPSVDAKALHAKIGQQALEIDFFAGALERQAMIDRAHEPPLTRQTALLGLSRASLYYTPGNFRRSMTVMRRLDTRCIWSCRSPGAA